MASGVQTGTITSDIPARMDRFAVADRLVVQDADDRLQTV